MTKQPQEDYYVDDLGYHRHPSPELLALQERHAALLEVSEKVVDIMGDYIQNFVVWESVAIAVEDLRHIIAQYREGQ